MTNGSDQPAPSPAAPRGGGPAFDAARASSEGMGDFVGALESVRGLAALAVAVFHCFDGLKLGGAPLHARTLWSLDSPTALLLRSITVLFNGAAAVSLFFVLSGFVLTLSLHRSSRPFISNARGFSGRRFLRIYPTVAVSLTLTFGIVSLLHAGLPSVAFPHWTVDDLVSNLLLWDFVVCGATWTLQVEILAIPFLLLGHAVTRKFGLAGAVALAVITIILLFSPRLALRTLFGGYVFLFFLGMLVAEFGRRGWLASVARSARSGLVPGIIALLGARVLLGYGSHWSVLVEGLASAGLIAGLAYGPRRGVHDLLETRPLRFLGRVSYSYYLYHPMALVMVISILPVLLSRWLLQPSPPLASTIVAIVTVTAAVPLAWASYVLVEKPMIGLGRRF